MATLTETATYTAGIYQLERTDAVDAGTGGAGISNQQAKDLANRTAFLRQFVITGEIRQFAFSAIPTGFLGCYGQAVSRTTFADLFAVIGITFGPGNGTTTFNVPDLRGQFLRGFNNGGGVGNASRVLGSTEAATTIGDYTTGASAKIALQIANPDASSGNNVPPQIGGGVTTGTNNIYSIRPDNVSVMMAIKT